MPPQMPVSFCFLTMAWTALEASSAARAVSMVSGAALPAGARLAKVRYRIDSPPWARSQPIGIR